MPVADIDTPALILDLDAFERNLARMAEAVRGTGVALRPHAKSHKCAEIARRQIALGAVGVCAQKVSEAEALVDDGVEDVLIANEVVGAAKLARLAALAKRARGSVCVENAAAVAPVLAAGHAGGIELEVLVEIDVGQHRCGIEPGEPAAALARVIGESPNLRFGGLQAYHGSAQHYRSVAERRAAIAAAAGMAHATKALIESRGIPCPKITGAGTGTFPFEIESGVYNEIQPGSYVFMDADYNRNQRDEGDSPRHPRFEQSLFVLTTVMSTPTADRAVVDAGLKAHSVDSGMPRVDGRTGIEFVKASDEHGVLAIERGVKGPVLGEKLKLIPGHCDPTVNLWEVIVCARAGVVEALWPVSARGAVW